MKPNKKSVGAVATAQERKGRSIGSYAVKGFVFIAAILLAGAAILNHFQQAALEQEAVARVKTGAKVLAARFSDQASVYNRLIGQISQDPEVVQLFLAKDEVALKAKAKQLISLIPQAMNVRLLPPAYNQPDTTELPHLGFASIDLLQRAIRSKGVMDAEIHQYGSDQVHIALVARVQQPGQDRGIGLIHVAFPIAAMQQKFTEIKDYGGHVELQQLSEGRAPLAYAENFPLKEQGSPDVVYPIVNSIWQVAAWHDANNQTSNDLILFWGIVGSVLALIGLVLWFVFRQLGQALAYDLGNIIKLNDRVLSGKGVIRFPAELRETGATMGLLAQRSADVTIKPTPAAASPKLPISTDESDSVSPAETETDESSSLPELDVEELVDEGPAISKLIFRDYDIRGKVGAELSVDAVYEIGRAIGSEAHERGQQTLIVGRDGRGSSPELAEAVMAGLTASGRDVIDLGVVPTPVVYFATHFLGSDSGVIITGSHNPIEYNGVKVVLDGAALYGEQIQALRQRIERGDFTAGSGNRQTQDLVPDYINRIVDDVRLAQPLKVVVDCGNGVAGRVAPALFEGMGCEVEQLYCDVLGDFPNHHPDPNKTENLLDLVQVVQEKGADLGLAFDGDGDRIGVVDSSGKIIWPDRLLMLLARDVLTRQPGSDIIYDVKCSRHLASEILTYGGRPVMWLTGHSHMKAKLKETGALLAGEMSGHIAFQERWYGFDDALYVAARLLEILAMEPRDSAAVFAELPESPSTPELHVTMNEGEPAALMLKLEQQANFDDARVVSIDGMRIEFEDGWGLVRASNTSPVLGFRFEAESEPALERIQAVFREQIMAIQPELELPF